MCLFLVPLFNYLWEWQLNWNKCLSKYKHLPSFSLGAQPFFFYLIFSLVVLLFLQNIYPCAGMRIRLLSKTRSGTLYLKRREIYGTSDTKSIKTKKKAFEIIYNIHLIDFQKPSFVWSTKRVLRVPVLPLPALQWTTAMFRSFSFSHLQHNMSSRLVLCFTIQPSS